MSIGRKVAGILAWAGLVVVVGVPAAEIAASKLGSPGEAKTIAGNTAAPVVGAAQQSIAQQSAVPASDAVVSAPADAVASGESAVVADAVPTPQAAPAAKPADDEGALDQYLASGKPLPDYITHDAEPSAPQQAASVVPAAEEAPIVANAAPMSPADGVAPSADANAAPAAETASTVPVPLPPKPRPRPPVVTEAQLKDWKSGSLEDYLRQHGLLTQGEAAPAAAN